MDVFDQVFANKQAEEAPAPLPTEQPPVEAPPVAEEAAPVEAVEAPMEAPPADAAPPQEKGDKTVPLVALLDERDKRKAEEAARKALEAELASLRAKQAPQEPDAIPDPYDDPAGYHSYVQSTLQQQTLAIKFELSEAMAKQAHGDDVVESAKEWAVTQPEAWRMQAASQPNPLDWIVRQHKQAEDLKLYQTDRVAFARRILEAEGQLAPDATAGAVPAVGQQPQASRPAAPPRSIASAPSSGGSPRDVAVGPLAAVDAVFTR